MRILSTVALAILATNALAFPAAEKSEGHAQGILKLFDEELVVVFERSDFLSYLRYEEVRERVKNYSCIQRIH
jgi:hypothetical protein